ncbi:hypothetical protein CRYUN_Cryun27aG0117200 [Craigia yunnanensis]
MEDAIFSSGAMLSGPPDSAMDFDYMDELLLDGCWLETTEGSGFLNPSPSSSNAFFDPAFIWYTSESNTGDLGGGLSQIHNQGEGENQRLLLPGNSRMNETQGESLVRPHFSHNMVDVDRAHSLHGDCITDGSELSRRWWIGPRTNPGPATSVTQRLIQALGYIKDFGKEKDVLVQLWVPVNRGGRRFLTTSEQPFSLDPNSQKLASYRNISVNYQFSAEEDAKDMAGLPGRVFLSKVPECTPDVRFFRSDEYPRVDHAQQHDVRGTFALPVFEQGSRTCLGVIEVVMTTEKFKIRPELESVCKALEAVNLRSSIASSTQNIKQGKEGCRHSTENYVHCVSTVDDACCIADPNIQGFHEACSEHHLLKDCRGPEGQRKMLNSLSIIIQQVCSTLRVVTDKELEEETDLAVSEVIAPSDGIPSGEELSKEQCTHRSQSSSRENSSWTASLTEVHQSSNAALALRKEKPRAMLNVKLSEVKQHQEHISLRESVECGDSAFNEISFSSVAMRKTGEKRRTKAEKTIALRVLHQYFAGSLKDAAKNIGVCPTTLKRICRQHGIKSWPSRKIKKVGHSLQKLQHVIDSVQGASGAFHISTFYANFPELASPKLSRNSTLSTSKLNDQPKQTNIQPEGGNFLSQAAISNSPSSSCSQSNSSSHCCSSGTHQPSKFNISGTEDLIIGESSGDGLDAQRVKVTYGDEKIRFCMQSKWRFKDLLHAITRRFNIDDTSGFDLKYLDDDSEWILLTCDADLEECIDIWLCSRWVGYEKEILAAISKAMFLRAEILMLLSDSNPVGCSAEGNNRFFA